jgi:hypothetical protein
MGADSRNTLVTGQCGSYIHDLGIDNRITCGSQVGRCDSHPNVAAIVTATQRILLVTTRHRSRKTQ